MFVGKDKGRPLILLIEDDDAQRTKYRGNLISYGFDVYSVGESNEEIVEVLRDRGKEFDIIVSDTKLKDDKEGVDFIEGAKKARQVRGDVFVLSMSSRPDTWEDWRGVDNHFWGKKEGEDIGGVVDKAYREFVGR